MRSACEIALIINRSAGNKPFSLAESDTLPATLEYWIAE